MRLRQSLSPQRFSAARSVPAQQQEISQGKTPDFHCVDAGFIKRQPYTDGGLDGHVPTGPTDVTPLIQFLFVIPQFCVGLPPDIPSRVCPCPFANLRLCEYLVSGLSPDKSGAMPGTHAKLCGNFDAAKRCQNCPTTASCYNFSKLTNSWIGPL